MKHRSFGLFNKYKELMRFSVLLSATISLALTIGCFRHRVPDEVENRSIYLLSREGFIQELIYAFATPRTAQFHDCIAGCYHVDKIDLLNGIKERRIRSNQDLIGAVIMGPFGPIWAYSVVVFLKENEGIRMNYLLFPHARITLKSTKLLNKAEFENFWGKLQKSPILQEGMPTLESVDPGKHPELSLEWRYEILIADWVDSNDRVFHTAGNFIFEEDFASEVTQFYDYLDKISDNSTVTYSNDISTDDSVYNPPTK
jgi:hypothetical protein